MFLSLEGIWHLNTKLMNLIYIYIRKRKISFATKCLKHCQVSAGGRADSSFWKDSWSFPVSFFFFCSLALALFLWETKPFQTLYCEENLILKLEAFVMGSTFCFAYKDQSEIVFK